MARDSYRISQAAGRDIDEIYDRVANDRISAATQVIRGLLATFEQLGRHPEMGTKRGELGRNLRSMTAESPASKYVVYYRAADDAIEIVRVLHGARDIETMF